MNKKLTSTIIRAAAGALRGRRLVPAAVPAARSATPGARPEARGPRAGGGVATAQRVQEIVNDAFRGKLAAGNIQRYGDGSFYLPTESEVTTILHESRLDRKTWTAERFDCDDFSYVLKGEFSAHAYDAGDISYGFAAGIVWGNFNWVNGFHAVNFIVLNSGALKLIEPQRDQIYPASNCGGGVNLIVV